MAFSEHQQAQRVEVASPELFTSLAVNVQ